jgi:hypothetical protein
MTVAADAATRHEQQKSGALAYTQSSPAIPGDYNMRADTVPVLPPGVEKFEDIRIVGTDTSLVGYLSILCGMVTLFLVATCPPRSL